LIFPGVPLPTRISIKPDRTYDLEICTPTTSWLLKQAAGIARGKQNPGTFTFNTPAFVFFFLPVHDMQQIVKQCRTLGIQVQREDLDPVELKQFLDKRREAVAEQLKALADKKAAKMLRTA
ncbi:hypothetical protein COOONC_17126, partial [Cooperia oncophora]